MEPSGLTQAIDLKLVSMTSERIPGFGKRVQEVLDEAGINRSEAMRKLGVAYTTVTKWVHGPNTPNVANLIPLAQLGGVHIEWLITGNGPKYLDDARNRAFDADEAVRRERYQAAVDQYLASELAGDIEPQVAVLLRDFDFSMLGIVHPQVKDVHRVRDLMDLQRQLRQLGRHGGTDQR